MRWTPSPGRHNLTRQRKEKAISTLDIAMVRAGAADAETVAGLLHALLDELAGGAGSELAALRSITQRLVDEEVVIGLVAHVDRAPAGLLMLNECATVYADGRFGEITELYVEPAHRSHGVAVQLIEEARKVARERGWTQLEVGAPDQPGLTPDPAVLSLRGLRGSRTPPAVAAVTHPDALAYLAKHAMPFAEHLGIEIVEAASDRTIGQITVRAEHCTKPNILHGGAVMAFADTLGTAGTLLNLPDSA